jgi:hypothetical protein
LVTTTTSAPVVAISQFLVQHLVGNHCAACKLALPQHRLGVAAPRTPGRECCDQLARLVNDPRLAQAHESNGGSAQVVLVAAPPRFAKEHAYIVHALQKACAGVTVEVVVIVGTFDTGPQPQA